MSTTAAKCTTDIRPLSEALQEKAKRELNEDSERISDDIQHLRDWLKKQPHLIARQDDHFLLSFLRGCKFSVQKAKQKLDYFHAVRTLVPDYYSNRNPYDPDIQRILRKGLILPLSLTNGLAETKIILIRWNHCDPAIVSFHSIVKLLLMVLDILINEDDNTVVAGVQYIVDYDDFAPGYVLQLTPATVHTTFTIMHAAYPLRIKKLEYMNLPKVFESVLVIVKKVLTKKLRNRLSVYSSKDILSASGIPEYILPVEYGGTGESLIDLTDKWKNKVESYKEFFEQDSKYYSDETLRPDISSDDSFGVEGTFRRLNID